MLEIRRCIVKPTVALTTSLNTTAEIDISNYQSGEIFIPTGSTITTLTYWVAPTAGGTYLPAQDSTPAAVVQTVSATKAYPIPAAVFGAPVIKIVTNANGTVAISLKS